MTGVQTCALPICFPVTIGGVNPNETFKIGYNGKTRTAALNTDAFTRIRENIQYYFVPFQSLWKYFEQQVNNLTKGDAGQNISKFASSSSEAASISTSMPYISYVDLASWLNSMYSNALGAVNQYFVSHSLASSRSAVDFKNWCAQSTNYSDVFICDGLTLMRRLRLGTMVKPVPLPLIPMRLLVFVKTYSTILYLIVTGKQIGRAHV